MFGGCDGCESGDRGCGWCSGACVVEVVCSLGMGVRKDGVGNRGGSVMSSGGNVSLTDGGGARWRDCCRFSDEIFGELREDLSYRLPFTLHIDDLFL